MKESVCFGISKKRKEKSILVSNETENNKKHVLASTNIAYTIVREATIASTIITSNHKTTQYLLDLMP